VDCENALPNHLTFAYYAKPGDLLFPIMT